MQVKIKVNESNPAIMLAKVYKQSPLNTDLKKTKSCPLKQLTIDLDPVERMLVLPLAGHVLGISSGISKARHQR